MVDKIPKENKNKSRKLITPIIPLENPEKKDLEPSEYIEHVCHNSPGNSTEERYIIKIPRFDSGTHEEWIIYIDLV